MKKFAFLLLFVLVVALFAAPSAQACDRASFQLGFSRTVTVIPGNSVQEFFSLRTLPRPDVVVLEDRRRFDRFQADIRVRERRGFFVNRTTFKSLR